MCVLHSYYWTPIMLPNALYFSDQFLKIHLDKVSFVSFIHISLFCTCTLFSAKTQIVIFLFRWKTLRMLSSSHRQVGRYSESIFPKLAARFWKIIWEGFFFKFFVQNSIIRNFLINQVHPVNIIRYIEWKSSESALCCP